MKARGPQRRWALSLADLALLIACMLLLSVQAGRSGAAAASATPASNNVALAQLFAPGEAVVVPGGIDALRHAVGTQRRVIIRVAIDTSQSARLDAWELAAARTAALGRMIATFPAGSAPTVHLGAPIRLGGTVEPMVTVTAF